MITAKEFANHILFEPSLDCIQMTTGGTIFAQPRCSNIRLLTINAVLAHLNPYKSVSVVLHPFEHAHCHGTSLQLEHNDIVAKTK